MQHRDVNPGGTSTLSAVEAIQGEQCWKELVLLGTYILTSMMTINIGHQALSVPYAIHTTS